MAGQGWRSITRTFLAGTTIALAVSFTGVAEASADEGAHMSIVGGKTTTIAENPWQVAFLKAPKRAPGKPPTERLMCGGSLISPTMIVTAGHCASLLDLLKPEYFSVIAGRTRLNDESTGQEVLASDVFLPTTKSGIPRYLLGAEWDVALVELAEPVSAEPIKLLGPDERTLLEPGRAVVKTGWGVTRPLAKKPKISNVLRKARTMIQPAKACSYLTGGGVGAFAETQVCFGDAYGKQGACYGDSGGPAILSTTAGPRLIGATSYGIDYACSPELPSVDAALGQPDLRAWLAETTETETGYDPVGTGGTAVAPIPRYCEVADILRLKLPAARRAIRANGCKVGPIRYLKLPRSLKYLDGRLLGTYPSAFTLTDPRHKVRIVVAKVKAKRKKR